MQKRNKVKIIDLLQSCPVKALSLQPGLGDGWREVLIPEQKYRHSCAVHRQPREVSPREMCMAQAEDQQAHGV